MFQKAKEAGLTKMEPPDTRDRGGHWVGGQCRVGVGDPGWLWAGEGSAKRWQLSQGCSERQS